MLGPGMRGILPAGLERGFELSPAALARGPSLPAPTSVSRGCSGFCQDSFCRADVGSSSGPSAGCY